MEELIRSGKLSAQDAQALTQAFPDLQQELAESRHDLITSNGDLQREYTHNAKKKQGMQRYAEEQVNRVKVSKTSILSPSSYPLDEVR